MNRSEQFVHDLAKNAFLSLWTYPNPIGKDKSKELCDVLVVCQPDIVVFSVKEIELKVDGDLEIQAARWKRSAIGASVKQIYGAQRRLATISHVSATGGALGVELGPTSERRIHRVAVAIGSGGSVPLESKDYGKGFVHVFDEETVFLLLGELDTVSDFVEYLTAREELLTKRLKETLVGSEADLLATYFSGTHSFSRILEGDYHLRVIVGTWDGFAARVEYRAKKRADEISYVWDRLIAQVHNDFAAGEMEFGGDLASVDAITRIMAREPRLQRRILGDAFTAFLTDSNKRSRFAMGDSGVGYVFLKQRHAVPRKYRTSELHARCFAMRDWMENNDCAGIVVGIATELPEEGSGFSLDLLLLDVPEWTNALRAEATRVREEYEFFKNPTASRFSGDEFPSA